VSKVSPQLHRWWNVGGVRRVAITAECVDYWNITVSHRRVAHARYPVGVSTGPFTSGAERREGGGSHDPRSPPWFARMSHLAGYAGPRVAAPSLSPGSPRPRRGGAPPRVQGRPSSARGCRTGRGTNHPGTARGTAVVALPGHGARERSTGPPRPQRPVVVPSNITLFHPYQWQRLSSGKASKGCKRPLNGYFHVLKIP